MSCKKKNGTSTNVTCDVSLSTDEAIHDTASTDEATCDTLVQKDASFQTQTRGVYDGLLEKLDGQMSVFQENYDSFAETVNCLKIKTSYYLEDLTQEQKLVQKMETILKVLKEWNDLLEVLDRVMYVFEENYASLTERVNWLTVQTSDHVQDKQKLVQERETVLKRLKEGDRETCDAPVQKDASPPDTDQDRL